MTLDERTKKLFLKLRKGADASLSLPQLLKVLTFLGGWRLEEVAQLVAIEASYMSENEGQAQAERTRLSELVVKDLPETPKVGRTYIQDLGEVKVKDGYKDRYCRIDFKAWMGCPGFRFTSPDGKVFTLIPERYEASRKGADARSLRKSLRLYDVLPWLKKETSYLQQISAALGMEPHEPATPRTRDNTGTCAVCFRNIKLHHHDDPKPPTMALHGYNRPGHGYILGRCWGGSHQPFEKSCEATQMYLDEVQRHLDAQVKYCVSLSDPNLTEFYENKWYPSGETPKPLKKEDANKISSTYWEIQLKKHIAETWKKVEQIEQSRDTYQWLVTHWMIRDLPKEGGKVVDYFGEAYTAAWQTREARQAKP